MSVEPKKGTSELPVLPIKSAVLFPRMLMPLAVGRSGSIAGCARLRTQAARER